VVLCGLEVPLEGAAALLTAGRRAGVITVLNPAPAVPGAGALVGLADILVPNETELVGLLDDLRLPHPPGSPATWVEPELAAAGRALTSFGATWVVVTLGAAGAALIGRAGRVWRCPAQAVRAVDTTAAGDAFVAGLTCIIASAGNLDRDTMRRACQQGAVVAAFSVQRRGAQPSLPTLADIGLLDE
jgi:ribokinase